MLRIFRANDAEVTRLLDKDNPEIAVLEERVREIVERVRREGDAALFAFTRQFDRVEIGPENVRVTEEEIARAEEQADDEFLAALETAVHNIRDFHAKQKQHSWMEPDERGSILGQICRPLERVGIYVPGGTAAYPSSVLMNALPAQVAGVKEIVMVSPPRGDGSLNPFTLLAAKACGVTEIYKVGGAQAVAALAYGTASIRRVDKITGPGNIYVTLAKKLVYGQVDIDMLAGPSEVLVIADSSANPRYVAADLLSQAEHDPMASAVLLTPSRKLAEEVAEEVKRQLELLSRRSIVEAALANYSAIVVTGDLAEAFELANRFAPEHLELMVENPFSWLGRVKNAGAIFIGPYSPEPVGDYIAGPNHILPTGGTARFYSPVTVDTFMKKSSVIAYSAEGFRAAAEAVVKLATVEGLDAHARAVLVRKEEGR